MAKENTPTEGAVPQPTNRELMELILKTQQDNASMKTELKELRDREKERGERPTFANDERKLDRQSVERWLDTPTPVGEFYYRNCERYRLTIMEATETTRNEGGAMRERGKPHIVLHFYPYSDIGSELFASDDPCKDIRYSRASLRSLGDVSISKQEIKEFGLNESDFRPNGRLTYSEALLAVYQSRAFKEKNILDGDSFKSICRTKYENDWNAEESTKATNRTIEEKLQLTASEGGANFLKLGKLMTPAGE